MERRELSAADIYCKFAAQLDGEGFRLYRAAQRITGFQPYDAFPYLLLKIGAEKRYIAENVIVYTAEQLARILFSEVSMDVLQMTGNDHTEQTADPLELAEIKRRWNPFLERLPEYQTVCEKILAGEK